MLKNIFDSHSHYDDDAFDSDRFELLSKELKSGGVCAVIDAGSSLEKSRVAAELSRQYDMVYAAVGIHPEECDDIPDDYIDEIRLLAKKSEKIVAIGEIGLDYHYEGYDKAKQFAVFEKQLILARELDLPVIIHSRDATGDMMEFLRKYRPRGVMHCFSGSAETAKEIQALGMYVGFTGVVTFKNAKKALEAVSAVECDRLLLETDCPYMAPVPHRSERCDSRMIEFTAEKIAEIKGLSAQEIVNVANENTRRLFRIKK